MRDNHPPIVVRWQGAMLVGPQVVPLLTLRNQVSAAVKHAGDETPAQVWSICNHWLQIDHTCAASTLPEEPRDLIQEFVQLHYGVF